MIRRLLLIAILALPLAGCGESGSPTAKCMDGTYSYSRNHSGTCSYHGGVTVWYKSQAQLDAGG